MRVTAVINQKGGVAKTTTCINMARILAKHKKKVLLIDLDPQRNLSSFFGASPDKGNTAGLLISGAVEYGLDAIRSTGITGIDILPASYSLMELDLSQLNGGKVRSPYIFRMLIIELRKRSSYDYVLFDCPPAFNSASASALIASDDVIIPIKLDRFSVEGMTFVMQQIQTMQKINPGLTVAGVLPTMWYKRDRIIEAEEIIRRQRFRVFPHIRRCNAVDEETYTGESSSGHAASSIDYKRFVAEYMEVTA